MARPRVRSAKLYARSAVAHEIKHGRLIPQPCEVCGAAPGQAHHDDYRKPLAVRWLCAAHHRRLHPPSRPRRYSAKRLALEPRARRLREAGNSYAQIAAALGISIATAYGYCTGKAYGAKWFPQPPVEAPMRE